jgi:hypothetical protein
VLGAGRLLADQVLPGVFDALALLGILRHGKGSLGASGVVADKDALEGERVSFERSPVQRFNQGWFAHCVGVCLRIAEDWACECQPQSHLSVECGGCSAVAIRSATGGWKVGRVSTAVKGMRGRQFLAGR